MIMHHIDDHDTVSEKKIIYHSLLCLLQKNLHSHSTSTTVGFLSPQHFYLTGLAVDKSKYVTHPRYPEITERFSNRLNAERMSLYN